MDSGFYSNDELIEFGFKKIGDDVRISRKASIYMPEKIELGNHIRIDDFCFLVGNIVIGDYVHLAPYASIHGTGDGSVTMKDFTGLSSYATIYAASDDYSGMWLTNPMVDAKYRNAIASDIVMEKHSLVGLHSLLLPGAYLAEGTAIGAMSVVQKKTKPWSIYLGVPIRRIQERSNRALELENEFLLEKAKLKGTTDERTGISV